MLQNVEDIEQLWWLLKMYFVTVGYIQHLEIYCYSFSADPNSVHLKDQSIWAICANFVVEISPKKLANEIAFKQKNVNPILEFI